LITDTHQYQHNPADNKWPKQYPITPIPGGSVTGKLIDLQSRFNVNNLTDDNYKQPFIQLLQTVNANIQPEQAKQITQAVIAWVTKPNTPDDSFDQFYLNQQPPYRAPHQPMADVSELRLVNGISAHLYNQLLPYITALPKSTPININTATAPVLASLSKSLDLKQATSIIDAREDTGGFNKIDNFLADPLIKTVGIDPKTISVDSNYFLCQATITIDKQSLTFYSLLHTEVDNKTKKITVSILYLTSS